MKTAPVAVIDIGSNTIRSLVVEPLPGGGYRTLDDEREVARLASGLTRRGALTDIAIRRAVRALERMAAIARGRGVRRIRTIATSAIRRARNRAHFVERVRESTGLRVRVISGAEEARLAFRSAALSFDLGSSPCAVVDVGGGSTELVLAIGGHIQEVHSLPLGAVTLTETHRASDPVRHREFRALRRTVRRALRAAGIEPDPRPVVLIASGGTASAVAQLMMARENLLGRGVQGFEMTQADLLHLRAALLRRTLAERRRMPGLSPDRADIIVAGVTILYEIMDRLRVNTLKVSARGIRHALVEHLIHGHGPHRPPAPGRGGRLLAAEAFGRSLRFEQAHARQVQRLALRLFDELAGPLGLEAGGRDLLAAAALLHDIGYVVSFRQHHKHTYHLIAHAQIDGFTPREHELMALVARYHRKAPPRGRHSAWAALPGRWRDVVRRLAALLRIADGLDRRHSQRVRDLCCRVGPRRVLIDLVGDGDLSVEIHGASGKAALFRRVFDRDVLLRACPARVAARRSSSARATLRRPVPRPVPRRA
jgi:exopolyphosphatase/guanosine-5'-triphosphate,3'-diphosphate pyrophosphatase